MRTAVKGLVFLLAVVASVAWATDALAVYSAGTRALVYYAQRSQVDGSAPGSARVLATFTNNGSSAVELTFWVFNASGCGSVGPFHQTFAAGETKILNLSDFATPNSFPEGYIDAIVTRASDHAPIQWDQMIASLAVIDFGLSTAFEVPGALLFSDDDNRASGDAQGGLFTNSAALQAFPPFELAGQFFPDSSEPGLTVASKLVLILPGVDAGTLPSSTSNAAIAFRQLNGTTANTVTVQPACMQASTLASIFGGTFASTFTGGGSLKVNPNASYNAVGWVLHIIQAPPAAVVTIKKLEGTLTMSESAHP